MVTASGQSKIFANTFAAPCVPGWAGQDIPGYLFNFMLSVRPRAAPCQWTQWVEILNILIGFRSHLVTIKLMASPT